MITVFTSYYRTGGKRDSEMDYCLEKNIACKHIGKIVLLVENGTPPENSKIVTVDFKKRPKFSDFFDEALKHQSDYYVLCNSDIYFDDSIKHVADMKKVDGVQECYALTRWEVKTGKQDVFSDSQDVWCFKKIYKPFYCDFSMGVPGCDNRLAHELHNLGYRVINPSKKIKCWHLHDEEERYYGKEGRILPPYKMVDIQ